jgi:DNA-binding IclR family transcriptional regulator
MDSRVKNIKAKSANKEKAAATGPRSLTRLLGLFDILAETPEGMALSELSESLNSPKSSLLNLFRPLVEEQYLSHSGGRYKIGSSLFRLSSKIMASWNFSGLMQPFVEELARATHESVYLGVLDKDQKVITYVAAIDSKRSIRYPINVGTSRPLYCTAAGRILLAFCEDTEWVEEYLKTIPIERRTDKTITNRRELRKRIKDIKECGFSTSIGELFEELGAIAVPVFGADGRIAAALAIGGPLDKIQDEASKMRELLTDVARRASGTIPD